MDHLMLLVEHAPDLSKSDIEASGDWLKKQIKNRIGITVGVTSRDAVDTAHGASRTWQEASDVMCTVTWKTASWRKTFPCK